MGGGFRDQVRRSHHRDLGDLEADIWGGWGGKRRRKYCRNCMAGTTSGSVFLEHTRLHPRGRTVLPSHDLLHSMT